jgi:hypothetical protein
MLNPWFALSFQATQLAWEAQNVMMLRFIRLAGGGGTGQSEARLMAAEKVAVPAEAQAAATTVAIKGGNGHAVAKKVSSVHKKRVRGNKRRLSK